MDKYRVTLSEEERESLTRMVSAGKAAARQITHARILLLADVANGPGRSDDAIVVALGVGPGTISRVRRQFVTEGLANAVSRKPQPPRPNKIKIKGDIEQQLVQLACSDPPEGRCRWTLELLATELVVLGHVKKISPETVRQALKKNYDGKLSLRRSSSIFCRYRAGLWRKRHCWRRASRRFSNSPRSCRQATTYPSGNAKPSSGC
jgi:transposase